MDSDVLTEALDRHPLVSLVSACFWVIRKFRQNLSSVVLFRVFRAVWLLSWFKALVAFATITIPRFIYSVLSYSMTLTVRHNPPFAIVIESNSIFPAAWILEFRDPLCVLRHGVELLDTLQVP
jgi:hypothetical protein